MSVTFYFSFFTVTYCLFHNFSHLLCNISVSLSLELDNNHEIVDHELINLVNNCKNLKELSVNAIISVATVEQLCELQREEKIGEFFSFFMSLCMRKPTILVSDKD